MIDWWIDMEIVKRLRRGKGGSVGSKKPNEWASCRNLDWELLWAFTAGVKPCTLLSLYCPGITSEETVDEEGEAETSQRPLSPSLLTKVADTQVGGFVTCPPSQKSPKQRPCQPGWVEGRGPHNVDKYQNTKHFPHRENRLVWIQAYVRDLIVIAGTKSWNLPCIVWSMAKL